MSHGLHVPAVTFYMPPPSCLSHPCHRGPRALTSPLRPHLSRPMCSHRHAPCALTRHAPHASTIMPHAPPPSHPMCPYHRVRHAPTAAYPLCPHGPVHNHTTHPPSPVVHGHATLPFGPHIAVVPQSCTTRIGGPHITPVPCDATGPCAASVPHTAPGHATCHRGRNFSRAPADSPSIMSGCTKSGQVVRHRCTSVDCE